MNRLSPILNLLLIRRNEVKLMKKLNTEAKPTVYAYKDRIDDFLSASPDEILGKVTDASTNFCILETQKDAWRQEIDLLQRTFKETWYQKRNGKQENFIYFEFNLMRFEKRVDVVLILEGILFCLEFKTNISANSKQYLAQDKAQALAYADEFSQFHSTSHDCPIVPLLVVPGAKDVDDKIMQCSANVFDVIRANENTIGRTLASVLTIKDKEHWCNLIRDPEKWEQGEYNTVPSIIDAAGRLFENQSVDAITRAGTDVTKTISTLEHIIRTAERNKECVICFVTGEPGAGKTLVGLQLAASRMEKQQQGTDVQNNPFIRKVFLSGNYPLVKVLKESLVRNFFGRLRDCLELVNRDGKQLSEAQLDFIKACGFELKQKKTGKRLSYLETIDTFECKKRGNNEKKGNKDNTTADHRKFSRKYVEATVSSMIQLVSHFRYGWKMSTNPPVENVFIFDEAQRAWDFDQIKRKDSKNKRYEEGWSEPRTLLEYLNRHSKTDGWCVAIALVGHGQDIHDGEAGIEEWYKALIDSPGLARWKVCTSDKRMLARRGIKQDINPYTDPKIEYSKLHLKDMQRSFKSKEVGPFVNALLGGSRTVEKAKSLLEKIRREGAFPLYITQDIARAKEWIREVSNNGDRRCGSVLSSRAVRLRHYGFLTQAQGFDEATWFLEPVSNINSSNALELSATEFKIQGLELDFVLVGWDGDMYYNEEKGAFVARNYSLKDGIWKEVKCLQKDDTVDTDGIKADVEVNPKDKERHLKNSYRVLLTRARQGMVIFVPKGEPDEACLSGLSSKDYCSTYKFLHDVIKIKDLKDITKCKAS